jgi:hypothetical protein
MILLSKTFTHSGITETPTVEQPVAGAKPEMMASWFTSKNLLPL